MPLEWMKRARINVLLVDDSQPDAMITVRAFTENKTRNYHFSVTQDGEEAISYLKREGIFADAEKYAMPDLILLDINMPKMNGFEFLTEVKAIKELRWIPVIMLTSSMDPSDIKHSYDLGAVGYVTKPVTYEEFQEFVKGFSGYWQSVSFLPKQGKHTW